MRKIPVTLPSSHAVHVLALLPSSLQPWGGGPGWGPGLPLSSQIPALGCQGRVGAGRRRPHCLSLSGDSELWGYGSRDPRSGARDRSWEGPWRKPGRQQWQTDLLWPCSL